MAKVTIQKQGDSYDKFKRANQMSAYERNAKTPVDLVSIGYNEAANLNGEVTMRGAGAATKGTKCRGPMA